MTQNLILRYAMAMLVTTALMIWVSVNEEGSWSSIPGQAAFWCIAVVAGWLQMILIARGVRSTFSPTHWAGWNLLLATALIGAVPITFEVRWLLDTIIAPVRGLPPPWLTYLNVTVINMVFCLVQYLLIERWPLTQLNAKSTVAQKVKPETPHQDTKNQLPYISKLSRRPTGLNGTIRYLHMEDHYLRVVSDEGEGLVLHRMGDARRELQESDGQQVHKSWWVSASEVAEIRSENRRRTIVLQDGTEIPVGRSFVSDLSEAGWF